MVAKGERSVISAAICRPAPFSHGISSTQEVPVSHGKDESCPRESGTLHGFLRTFFVSPSRGFFQGCSFSQDTLFGVRSAAWIIIIVLSFSVTINNSDRKEGIAGNQNQAVTYIFD
jgi:hypothetical protein